MARCLKHKFKGNLVPNRILQIQITFLEFDSKHCYLFSFFVALFIFATFGQFGQYEAVIKF